jgi:hypothetical protein
MTAKRTTEEYDRFTALVDRVIAVPKAEIQKREEASLRESAANPKKRGPKTKKRKQ